MTRNVVRRLHGKPTEQILLYLGGHGGCGKTRVIQAITHLFVKLGKQHELRLGAFTGTAASGIDGSTISSLAQISSDPTRRSNQKKLEATWDTATTLIADEVSMIGCRMLSKTNKNITLAKKHADPDVPFGGLDVMFAGMFVGDCFNQLNEINDLSMYMHYM